MADIRQTRRKLIIAAAVMLVLDIVSIAILISPIGRGSREGRQKEAQLLSELQVKTRQTIPLRGLDAKIVNASKEIKSFYAARFPDNFAAVPARLNKLASEHGVKLSAAQYSTEPTDVPGVNRVKIQAGIDGDYLKEAKFINAVERDRTFFIIDNVALGEQQKGDVHLQITFETYVRSASAS